MANAAAATGSSMLGEGLRGLCSRAHERAWHCRQLPAHADRSIRLNHPPSVSVCLCVCFTGRLAQVAGQMGVAQAQQPLESLSKGVSSLTSMFAGGGQQVRLAGTDFDRTRGCHA